MCGRQSVCSAQLHFVDAQLGEFGVTPKAFDSAKEPIEKVRATCVLNPPSEEHIAQIVHLATPNQVAEPTVPDNLSYDAEATKSAFFLNFPFDSRRRTG
jgi:hypothetical protein